MHAVSAVALLELDALVAHYVVHVHGLEAAAAVAGVRIGVAAPPHFGACGP